VTAVLAGGHVDAEIPVKSRVREIVNPAPKDGDTSIPEEIVRNRPCCDFWSFGTFVGLNPPRRYC
jgi:hypothetical protein